MVTPTMQAVLEYWYSDLTVEEVAEKLGISVDRLNKLRDRYKIPARPRVNKTASEERNPSPEEIAAAALQIRQGWTPTQERSRRVSKDGDGTWTPPRFSYSGSTGSFTCMR